MSEAFADMLLVGGKTNSLGRTDEVIKAVMEDKSLLEELYQCMFAEDAWVKMRASDAFEKVCREHPEWVDKYIDRVQQDLSGDQQASIQWHIAQIYGEVKLSDSQRQKAINWLEDKISTTDVDWIVSGNCMNTLIEFTKQGYFDAGRMKQLLEVQSHHKSKAVRRRAAKLAF